MEFDADSVARKFANTYCWLKKNGERTLIYVTEAGRDGSGNDYVHYYLASDVDRGVSSSSDRKSATLSTETGKGSGYTLDYYLERSRYLHTGKDLGLFLCKLSGRSYRAGTSSENYLFQTIGNEARMRGAMFLSTIPDMKFPKKTKGGELLSPDVAIVGGEIRMLEVRIGMVGKNNTARVSSPAVGHLLKKLLPTWTIQPW